MPFLRVLLLLAVATPLLAADKAAPVPAPAFMDVVTFDYRTSDENHKVVVTSAPGVALQRIDESDDGYSVIYDPLTQHYSGLEHRNYTWWEFSWPEVRGAVENSKRYEKRLQDLGSLGLNDDDPNASTTNAPAATPPPPTTTSAGTDDSGFVWRPTKETKRINDLDCVRWTGTTESGETIDAWCYAGLLPKVESAIAILHTVSEPIELVPVRTLVPDQIFSVYRALGKGGVTPVLVIWGPDHNKSQFRFLEAKSRDGKSNVFTVPKLYTKTTLITMDGMIDSQPAPGKRRSDAPTKTWQNRETPAPADPMGH